MCDIDLRPGGSWRYVLRANGGFDVAFHGVYHEVVADERIVSTEVFEMVSEAEALATTEFRDAESAEGRTVLSILVSHPTQLYRDMHLQSGMEEGMNEAFDLLAQLAA